MVKFLALDMADGHTMWSKQIDNELETNPAVSGGSIYLATYVPRQSSDGSGLGTGAALWAQRRNWQAVVARESPSIRRSWSLPLMELVFTSYAQLL